MKHKSIATLKWRYKKFLKLVFCIIFLSIYISILGQSYARIFPKQPNNFTQHTVKPNEALWGISQTYLPGIDPRQGIAWIEEVNELPRGYILQPGDELEVPTYEGGLNP